ncbi:MAG: NERD domain-containing protein [Candidatus Cloacimonetes bacterium]|nr:NERD domain-containing protein [Candidatus Cloacimonadota bacterium]
MGTVYPPLESLTGKHQPPTEGELLLLKAFQQYLPGDCEIFFQPYLNGDRPDIVILRKGYGAHIVEVKDWNLDYYNVDNQGNWCLTKDKTRIKSPVSQVQCYKDNFYSLHVQGLLEKEIKNKKLYGLVTCSVYFHRSSTSYVNTLLKNNKQKLDDKRESELKHTLLFGNELLQQQQVYRFMNQSKLHSKSDFFDDELYERMRIILKPPYHYLEEGIDIKYTAKQLKLTESIANVKRKIKGVAGAGKSLVLAKRAVNAHIRTGDKVLILTFNITLINYIHDLINNVREGFSWSAFEIINYHEFINSATNNMSLENESEERFDDVNFFNSVSHKTRRYKAILIDEAQDYQEPWFRIIQEHFLADDGEFVVFADEKQNIYQNQLDTDRKVKVPGIPGVWNESMNRPFRYTGRLIAFIKAYQASAFKAKYSLDEFEIPIQSEANIGESVIDYVYLDRTTTPPQIKEKIRQYLKKNMIHPSDTVILNSRIALLREIDYLIRQGNEKTATTFETKEIYDQYCSNGNKESSFKAMLKTVRRNKKRHFMMKTGTMKISTIHSFKGWEIQSAIVIIEPEDCQDEFETEELIYTGLTRARVNLLIINAGNAKYDQIIRQAIG